MGPPCRAAPSLYVSDLIFGAPDRTRTCNPRIRSPMRYPLRYGGVGPIVKWVGWSVKLTRIRCAMNGPHLRLLPRERGRRAYLRKGLSPSVEERDDKVGRSE